MEQFTPFKDSQTGQLLFKNNADGKIYQYSQLPPQARIQYAGAMNNFKQNMEHEARVSHEKEEKEKAIKAESDRMWRARVRDANAREFRDSVKKGYNDYVKPAAKVIGKGIEKIASNVVNSAQAIGDSIRANQQASKAQAHANRQAEIAENAGAETNTYKQRANQIANRDERVEAAKDAATNAASKARAQIGNGAARSMGTGAASLMGATTAAQSADTQASVSENRSRTDTQAQNAASLAARAAQQQANAENMRQQGDEAAYAMGMQNSINAQKDRLANALPADVTNQQENTENTENTETDTTNQSETTEDIETDVKNSSLTDEEKQTLLALFKKFQAGRTM